MIDFKPVRLGDRAVLERYTMPSGICNCDLAFANLYCWQAVCHSAWAESGGFLVIRFQIDGGERIGYMQPVGEGDFGPILPLLREDAHAHGQRLRIIGLTDEGRDTIRRIVPCHFAFESDRALEDYVYNADDLRNLAGRRYQPKRNHLNRFTAEYPDSRYEELTPDRFGECMALEREWRKAHGRARCGGHDIVRIGQDGLVYPIHYGRHVASRSGGDEHLLRTGLYVRLRLRTRAVCPAAFEHNVDIELAPGQCGGIRLTKCFDSVVSYHEHTCVLVEGYARPQGSVLGAVRKQVGDRLHGCDVVHGHELHVLATQKRAHHESPYASHPVHSNTFHELSPFPRFLR